MHSAFFRATLGFSRELATSLGRGYVRPRPLTRGLMPLQRAVPDAAVPAATKSPGWSPVADLERPGLVGVPPAIQQNPARQVVARWSQELGNPSLAEVTDVLVLVVATIPHLQIPPHMFIDAQR